MFQDVSRTLWSKTWDKCIETSLVRPRPVCCAVPGLPVAAMDQKRLCEDLRCDMMCSCFFRFLQHPSAVHAFAYQPWPVDWWHIVEFLNWWKRETTNILESSWVYNVPISSYFIHSVISFCEDKLRCPSVMMEGVDLQPAWGSPSRKKSRVALWHNLKQRSA